MQGGGAADLYGTGRAIASTDGPAAPMPARHTGERRETPSNATNGDGLRARAEACCVAWNCPAGVLARGGTDGRPVCGPELPCDQPPLRTGTDRERAHRRPILKAGSESWKDAPALLVDRTAPAALVQFRDQYRGSILNLAQDTSYELQYRKGIPHWTGLPNVSTRSRQYAGTTTTFTYPLAGKHLNGTNRLSLGSNICIAGTDKRSLARADDAGILVGGLVGQDDRQNVMIEHNRLHDPRYRSTRWEECTHNAHPWGSRAIAAISSRQLVIRYNNIYATNS